MEKNVNIRVLVVKIRSVYEQYGLQYDVECSWLLFEKKWFCWFENLLFVLVVIFDVGCGGGELIGCYFIEQGYVVIGIDFVVFMVELVKVCFFDSIWYWMDMWVLDL